MIHFSSVLSSISVVTLKSDNKVVTVHCIALAIFLNQDFGKKPPTNMTLYFAVENEYSKMENDKLGAIECHSLQVCNL